MKEERTHWIKLSNRRITIEQLNQILKIMEDTKSDFFIISYYKDNGDPYGGYHPEDCDKIVFYRYVSDEELRERKIKELEDELNELKKKK